MAITKSKNPLGQYFTPPHIAKLMVEMLVNRATGAVLEPSCGEGVFLKSLEFFGYSDAVGVEIDPNLVIESRYPVHRESFLTWKSDRKFDSVIGNPPYIRWKDLGESAKAELKTLPGWDHLFNSLSDFLIPFIYRSVEMLNPGGEIVFITPSFWMHTQHSAPLREWLLEQGSFSHLVHFGEAEVFPGVSSSIVIFRFVKGKKIPTIKYFEYIGSRKVSESCSSLQMKEQFIETQIPSFKNNHHWTLAPADTQARLDIFEKSCSEIDKDSLFKDHKYRQLGELVNIANGMVSGLDKAFRVPQDCVEDLNQNEVQASLKVLKAHQLQSIYSEETTLYIDIPKGLSEQDFRKSFPTFSRLLDPYKEELMKRYSYGVDLPYWEWSFRRSEAFFLDGSRKIFIPCKERITSKPLVRFSVSQDSTVATQDVTAFAPKGGVREDVDYLVAMLSIPEVTDWVRYRGLLKGGVAEFSERPLAALPVRVINWEIPREIEIHDTCVRIMKNVRAKGQISNDQRMQLLASIHELLEIS